MAGLVPGTAEVQAGQARGGWGVATAVSGAPGLAAAAPVTFRPPVAGVAASDGENSQYVIHGISFWGRTGWLYLDDAGIGTPGNAPDRTLVYRTEDGGRSWSLIQQSIS
jgi:hypothetical protein